MVQFYYFTRSNLCDMIIIDTNLVCGRNEINLDTHIK